MYQVLKVLNNNTILAKEDDNEIIVMAKGIGFGKKVNEHFEIPPHAKKYMMQKNYQAKDKQKKVIDYINKEINNDEVGFITLHIHTAISSNKVGESMEAARVVHESIIKLQTDLNMKIDVESISYARLMNHIKFLIIRLNTNEQLQMDISEFTKNKFPFAYEQAIRMCDNLSKVLHKELPASEIGYLALHLERILSSAFQN